MKYHHLLLMLVLLPVVNASITSTVTVVNSAPIVKDQWVYEYYLSPQSNIRTSSITLCKNQDRILATAGFFIEDANGHEDLVDDGTLAYKLTFHHETNNDDVERFGSPYKNLQLQENDTLSGHYTGNFNFTRQERTTDGNESYRYRHLISDGEDLAPYDILDFNYSIEPCTYERTDLLLLAGTPQLFESELTNTTLLIKSPTGKSGTIVMRRGVNDRGQYGDEVKALGDLLEIRSTEGLLNGTEATMTMHFDPGTIPKKEYRKHLTVAMLIADNWHSIPEVDVDYGQETISFNLTKTGFYALVSTKEEPSVNNACRPKWKCDKWGECVAGEQTRNCVDKNGCNIWVSSDSKYAKPIDKRPCEMPKQEKDDKKKKKKKFLFDINAELLEDLLSPEDNLTVKIQLLNFGEEGVVEVNVTTTINDRKGTMLFQEQETVYVESQKEYLRQYGLGLFRPGVYDLIIDISYQGQEAPATATERFTIKDESRKVPPMLVPFAFLLMILFLSRSELQEYFKKKKIYKR